MGKKRALLLVSLIFLYAIIIIGTTYAYMSVDATNSIATGEGGCFEVSYTGQNLDAGNILATTNYLEGAHTTITLSKDASCKIYTEANIYLHTNDTTTAPIETVPALKYKLLSGSTQISEGIIKSKGDSLLTKVPLTNTATTYTIYLWIDPILSNGTYNDKNYSGYIYAETAQTSTVENSHLVSFDTDGGNKIPDQIAITGNTYGNLPTPTREGYTFKGWSLVPDGYQQIEYIESSGTQHIDTKVYANVNTIIDLEAMCTDSRTDNSYTQVTGARESYHASSAIQVAFNISTNNLPIDYGTSGISGNLTVSKNTKFTVHVQNNNITINGSKKTQVGTFSGTSPYSLWIFDINNMGNSYIGFRGRIYSYNIYENNNIIRNFIPCYKKDNPTQAGLYDTVTNTFYENEGTGTFTKGSNSTYITNSSTVTQTSNHTLYAVWQPKTYTVTLNANGGTVSPSTMQVTYNNPYGNLPTPTRNGYTFKGWNGKNLLKLNVTASTPSNESFENTTKRTFIPNTYIKGLAYNNYYRANYIILRSITDNNIEMTVSSGYGIGYPLLSNENKTYTLSYNMSSTGTGLSSIMYYKSDGELIDYIRTDGSGNKTVTFTTPTDTYYLVIEFASNGTNANVSVSNIKLEEGNTATEYEPYFVLNNTNVTQAKNHTLTAIWEQN